MVNWTANKDQTILKGIFAFHDIKSSKPLLEYLATEIGDGCTPKAVSHRLTNLRNSGKAVNKGKTTFQGSPFTPKAALATPRTPRVPKTPASFSSNTATSTKKSLDDNLMTDEETAEDDMSISPSAGRKRARASRTPKSYVESDAESDNEEDEFVPATKRVKEEIIEDEDEGEAFV